jgi:large subunit ribosomal protein L15
MHTLQPNKGARHRKKRLGSGESSGLGKTCGKGNKGQKSRAGAGLRPGFEGGQMPLYRRLPKKGFSNAQFRRKVLAVNVRQLEAFFNDGETVDAESLRAKGLITGRFDAVTVLRFGDIAKALTVSVDEVSAGARTKIEQAGGTIAGVPKAD